MGTKKPYQKPTLTKVELRPDEAVLTACKTQYGGGPRYLCRALRCRWNQGS
jgi:hypothetical protein